MTNAGASLLLAWHSEVWFKYLYEGIKDWKGKLILNGLGLKKSREKAQISIQDSIIVTYVKSVNHHWHLPIAIVPLGRWQSPLGGDCRSVVDQLVDVQDMSGSNSAFAVIKNDGTVLAWGDCAVGGDSRTLAYVCPKIFSISISFFNTNNFAFFFFFGGGIEKNCSNWF